MSKIRIKDIALKAGVSVGTVDRVIHNRGRVGKDAEQRVRKILKELDYEPNLAARSLARGKDHMVAVVLPDHVEDEFWRAQQRGVLRALKQMKDLGLKGDIFTFNDRSPGDLAKLIPQIFSGKYEALVIASTHTEEAELILSECERQNIFYVQINSFLERQNDFSLGYVGQDSYQSGKLAGKLLEIASPPKSKVALIHMEEDVDSSIHLISKENGFLDYYKKNTTIKPSTYRFANFKNKGKLQNLIKDLVSGDDAMKGLFVTTSRVHYLVEAMNSLNRKDVVLVGFDLIQKNIEALSLYKPLFLINQNPSLQGYYGVLRLFDFIIRKRREDHKKFLPLDIITLENVSNYQHMLYRDNEGKGIL